MEQNNDTDRKDEFVSKEIMDVLPDHLQDIMSRSQGIVTTAFNKCVILSVCLPNGQVLTETFAFAREKNFNMQRGHEACMAKIVDRLYELETFRLLCENPEPYVDEETKRPKSGLILPDKSGNIIMPPEFG